LEDDGDYFTWTLDELKAALSESEAAVAAQYYHIEPAGEMHHNLAKNVLFIDQPLEAIAARLKTTPEEVAQLLSQAKKKMLEARLKRPTPYIDTTLYASWNGMMISAFLDAYKILGNDEARDHALLTLDLFLEKAYDPNKGMAHSLIRVPAQGGSSPSAHFDFRASNFDLLDDQVFIATALLDAYEVMGQRRYYDHALSLVETTLKRFWDEEHGGFFDMASDTAARQGALTMSRKGFQDAPTPAANSQAVIVLDRLAQLADRPDFREKARAALDLFAPKAREYGLFVATYGLALVNHLRPSVEVVVVGPRNDHRTNELLRAAHQAWRAGKRVLFFEPGPLSARDLPAGLAATLPHLPYDGNPLALVCVGTACQAPVQTPGELTALLKAQTA
jgi:uncharacterized protein YyaL (SSP411 family)